MTDHTALKDYKASLDHIASKPDGWFEGEGVAVSAQVLEAAYTFAALCVENGLDHTYTVSADPDDGSIDFYWMTTGSFVSVSIEQRSSYLVISRYEDSMYFTSIEAAVKEAKQRF